MSDLTFVICGALAMFLLLGLIYGVHYWFAAKRNPPCRTANARAIARQVDQLQANVPTAAPRRSRAGQPANGDTVVNLQERYRINAEWVTRQGRAAAEHDLRHGTTTPNPHAQASRAHIIFFAGYEQRMLEEQVARHA